MSFQNDDKSVKNLQQSHYTNARNSNLLILDTAMLMLATVSFFYLARTIKLASMLDVFYNNIEYPEH